MHKYKYPKAFERAVGKLEKTVPDKPVKGVGHERVEVADSVNEALRNLLNMDMHADGNHVATVFARRSFKAKYNKMQFGPDRHYVSPAMHGLLAGNEGLLLEGW